jgi:competence protein ComEC
MRNNQAAIVLCLAYVLGLLATFAPWARWIPILVGLIIPLVMFRISHKKPNWRLWLGAIAIAICASFYLELRIPRPAANDISRYIPATVERGTTQFVIVEGTVDSYPHVTRNNHSQFWLNAARLNEIQGNQLRPADVSRAVGGRVYVTVPLQSGTGLQPGVEVSITGTLYLPQKVVNPGGFSFRDYLSQSGTFAGMRGVQLRVPDESQTQTWSWGKLRRRIAAAQVKWLEVPVGPLLTAMVLGSDAVDLPFDLRDRFVRVGLAHALAASGFQVSLILGALLAITKKRLSLAWQFNVGVVALLIFLGLTGLQPAVVRSVVMGMAVLIALRTERKIKPLSALSMAGILLLIFNPIWIWDIGFQLSFLATLGLIVTATPLQKKLDWLPPTISEAIAVPLAASIWTLPIQLYVFKVFPLYCLPANILTSPLISVVSIGGAIAAFASAIFPIAGSAISWLLFYPTQLLIWIVDLFNDLPGASLAVGQISTWQLFALYGLIFGVWRSPKWQKYWHTPTLVGLILVIVPLLFMKANELQITVLASNDRQLLVVQDRGQTMLINSGNESTVRYTTIPFFQQQAIDRVDTAILFQPGYGSNRSVINDWQAVKQLLPIDKAYNISDQSVEVGTVKFAPLPIGISNQIGRILLKPIQIDPTILEISIPELKQKWAIIGDDKTDEVPQIIDRDRLTPVQTIYWGGGKLTKESIDALSPEVAIAASSSPDPDTIKLLEQNNVRLYYTGRDGAIQWTPTGEFKPYLEGERSE